MLGWSLTPEEARYFTGVVRRIAAILLLEPQLDANYRAVKGDSYMWRGEGKVRPELGGAGS